MAKNGDFGQKSLLLGCTTAPYPCIRHIEWVRRVQLDPENTPAPPILEFEAYIESYRSKTVKTPIFGRFWREIVTFWAAQRPHTPRYDPFTGSNFAICIQRTRLYPSPPNSRPRSKVIRQNRPKMAKNGQKWRFWREIVTFWAA